MSIYRKEPDQRAGRKSRPKKDTFELVAAERAKELDAIRQRTAQLRRLRLAQEKRGRAPQKLSTAGVAKSVTKETFSDRLDNQQRPKR